MSDLLCIATIVLTGLTQASLQLSFGALILLYHASLSRHRRKRTRYLAKGYIWGAASISFLMLCSFAFLIQSVTGKSLSLAALLVAIGLLCGLSVVMQFFYFRRGKNTELWLPRSFSRYIMRRAKKADDIIETFSLGAISNIAEFPLSVVLYLVGANAVLQLQGWWQLLGAILYTALSILPLMYLKISIKTGKNAIDIQKWRMNNKSFLKNIASGGFLTLAFFLAGFWIAL